MHEKQWQNALETANEIIGLNYYELEKDYASIFSAQNEGNKELMFVVRLNHWQIMVIIHMQIFCR